MTTTSQMAKALKDHCVPELRKMGFKGSFPNFYRDNDSFVSLVNFQFNRLGEKFCINLGFVDAERRNLVSHCKDAEPQKMRVSMTGGLIEDGNYLSGSWRVGSQPLGDGVLSDSWFSFAPGQYGADRSKHTIDPKQLALHCAELFKQEAENWWDGRRAFAAQDSEAAIE